MESIMTDFLYTSGASTIGFGVKEETINKEVIEYPAPNLYESRKNDKIVAPEIRQRERVTVKNPEPKKRLPRRKKDREQTDPRMRRDIRAPVISGEEGKKKTAFKVKDQNIYTLGMAERDKKRASTTPGPGTHEYQSYTRDGPNYKIVNQGNKAKAEAEQTGPGSYEAHIKSRAPKYSFGTRTTVTLGFGPKQPFKSMKPGPGNYENKDVQFKNPCARFSKAEKKSLANMNGVPGSDTYYPEAPELESNNFSFPRSQRLVEPGRDRNARKPGPGEYEVLNSLPRGQAKSMLGGPLQAPKIKDNGVPGPGNYFEDLDENKHLNHIQGVRIVDKPPRFREPLREIKDDDNIKKGK